MVNNVIIAGTYQIPQFSLSVTSWYFCLPCRIYTNRTLLQYFAQKNHFSEFGEGPTMTMCKFFVFVHPQTLVPGSSPNPHSLTSPFLPSISCFFTSILSICYIVHHKPHLPPPPFTTMTLSYSTTHHDDGIHHYFLHHVQQQPR